MTTRTFGLPEGEARHGRGRGIVTCHNYDAFVPFVTKKFERW